MREEGTGEAVLGIHGVPASCFLYRKVLHELAARGLRGIAFDLPGMGLPNGHRTTTTRERDWAGSVSARSTQLGDGGAAFMKIMPGLRLSVEGEEVRRAIGADTIHRGPGKHFLQEDQAPAIADRVLALTAPE